MIYPNDLGKMWWDVIMSLILLLSIFITPLDLAFAELADRPEWPVINRIVDVFFLSDMLLTFFSALQDDEFYTIEDRKEIAKLYLKGWFLIDLVSILPLD